MQVGGYMLEVRQLNKHYGNIKSVNNINFILGENETVGLLGKNGAGKSTTMRMLAGYIAPTSGEILIDGISILENQREVKKRIGYLPEIPPLYSDMTVMEHLSFVCDLKQIKVKQKKEECERVCQKMNLGQVKNRLIAHLSKGYRQRVGFAAALIGKPKILILDEPTVGLDPQQMLEIRELIKTLSKEMSIIISSHVLTEISSVCSRIMILNKGNLVADGKPEDIENKYIHLSELSLIARGDKELVNQLISECLPKNATVSNLADMHYNITCPMQEEKDNTVNLSEKLFFQFAKHSPRVSIIELKNKKATLEDVFITLTKEGIA